MEDLNGILDRLRTKENLPGLGIATYSANGLELNCSGSDNSAQEFSRESQIPFGSLVEPFIAALFHHMRLNPKLAVAKALPKTKITEEKFSMQLLVLDHLLSHSSGLSKRRNTRDVIAGETAMYQFNSEESQPLDQYYHHELIQLRNPSTSYLLNENNYGLIAAYIETEADTPFEARFKSFLSEFTEDTDWYQDKIPTGYARTGRKGYQKVKPKYFNSYPSTMAHTSLENYLGTLYRLLFDQKNAEQLREFLFHPVYHKEKVMDPICRPFRYRPELGIYQIQSFNHGYTLSLIIDHDNQVIHLSFINLSSSRSSYLANKLLRIALKSHGKVIPDYPTTTTIPDDLDSEELESKFIFTQPDFLLLDMMDHLSTGFYIFKRKNELILRSSINGILEKYTPFSRTKHLVILDYDQKKLLAGYDDGLYLSKLLIPTTEFAPFLIMELYGPTIFYRSSSTSSMGLNLKMHSRYYIAEIVIPAWKRVFWAIWHLPRNLRGWIQVRSNQDELSNQETKLHQKRAKTHSQTAGKEYKDHDELTKESNSSRVESKIVIAKGKAFFKSIPVFFSPFFKRFPSDLRYTAKSIAISLYYGSIWLIKHLLDLSKFTWNALKQGYAASIIFFPPFLKRFKHDISQLGKIILKWINTAISWVLIRIRQRQTSVETLSDTDTSDRKDAQEEKIQESNKSVTEADQALIVENTRVKKQEDLEMTEVENHPGHQTEPDEIEKEENGKLIIDINELNSVTSRFEQGLREAGYNSVKALRKATIEDLTKIKGIGKKTAEKLLAEVSEYQ